MAQGLARDYLVVLTAVATRPEAGGLFWATYCSMRMGFGVDRVAGVSRSRAAGMRMAGLVGRSGGFGKSVY